MADNVDALRDLREAWEACRASLFAETDPRAAIKRAFIRGYVYGSRDQVNVIEQWRAELTRASDSL